MKKTEYEELAKMTNDWVTKVRELIEKKRKERKLKNSKRIGIDLSTNFANGISSQQIDRWHKSSWFSDDMGATWKEGNRIGGSCTKYPPGGYDIWYGGS